MPDRHGQQCEDEEDAPTDGAVRQEPSHRYRRQHQRDGARYAHRLVLKGPSRRKEGKLENCQAERRFAPFTMTDPGVHDGAIQVFTMAGIRR